MRFHFSVPACACALLSVSAPTVRAQVAEDVARPLNVWAYAAADGSNPELGFGRAFGYSGGMVVHRNHAWFAVDTRGVILRERVPIHTYLGEAGPRFTHRFGSLRAYGEGMGGIAHTLYSRSGQSPLGGWGKSWTALGGVDLPVAHRFEWRVAEYSYSHIYAGTGATPTILSTGLVFRVF